ncbi:hypothetical protein D3C71_834990 [compost metagenome]
MTQLALFLGGRKDADPQGFGEIEQATGGGGVVALHVALFHQTGDGQAKDRFWRVDGVPTCQRDARRVTHRTTAAYHFPGNFRGQHVHRPAQNRNRHQRIAAHRIDVADGIGGGNSTEIEGIVDDRHEKVGGRDHAAFIIDCIHRRIIARGIADPKFRVEVLRPTAGQDHFQHLGRNLATASSAVAVLSQANRLAHRGTSLGQWADSSRARHAQGVARPWTLWERACSRRGLHSRHPCRLILRHREQVRSHIDRGYGNRITLSPLP